MKLFQIDQEKPIENIVFQDFKNNHMGNFSYNWVLESFEEGYVIERNKVTGERRKLYPDGYSRKINQWR